MDDQTGEEYYIKFSAQTITEVKNRLMQQGMQRNHTVMHEVEVDGCCIVEIWQKESDVDKSVALGLEKLPNGTLFIGSYVENDAVWEGVKNGEFRGWSIEALFQDVSITMSEEKLLEKVREILES
jgi:hypothetical protein